MAGNSGGPWGGGSDGPKRPSNGSDGGRPPKNNNQGQMPPEIDDMLKKGQEQLRVLMGGGGKKVAVVQVLPVTVAWDGTVLH